MAPPKSKTMQSAPDTPAGKKPEEELSHSLYKTIKSRIRELEKSVGDAVTSSSPEQKTEQIDNDKKAVGWWKDALEKVTAMRSSSNNSQVLDQVRMVESCVVGRNYSEKTEKLEIDLAVCRRAIDLHRKKLEKLESDAIIITNELAETHDQFRGELKKMLTAEL